MQFPRLEKVILSTGTGKVADKKRKEFIGERIARIAGQRPSVASAKKSIASFKVRQGDAIGYRVTLRGERMINFLEKLIHVALPRTKDFRGVAATGVDPMGNFSFGIKEHTVFPETSDENIQDVFSLGVTLVTTSSQAKETKAFCSESRLVRQIVDAPLT